MAETNFTPGPWKRNGSWIDTPKQTIGQLFLANCTNNGNLIAAAPDLYKMLADIIERHEQYRNREATMHEFECCIDSAVELLAKARGEA